MSPSRPRTPKQPKKRESQLYEFGEDLEKYIHSGVSLLSREIYVGDISHGGSIRFHKNIIMLESISDKPITIHFNSEGGEEDPGWAMYDVLRRTACYTVGVAWGSCSSMASIIFQACDKRLIAPNCSFMIHEGSITSSGTSHIRNSVSIGEETKRKLEWMYQVYSEHTKLKNQQLKTMIKENMGGDLYLSVQDVIKYGFADEVVELNKWPKKLDLKHVPKHMRKKGKIKCR